MAVRAPINIAATVSETGVGGEKADAPLVTDAFGQDRCQPRPGALAIRRIGGLADEMPEAPANASRPGSGPPLTLTLGEEGKTTQAKLTFRMKRH